MPRAAPVGRLEVRVLVDNSADMLSTPGLLQSPSSRGCCGGECG
jgi:hypothetical protein